MSSRRRILIGLLAALGGAGTLSAVVWLWWIPSTVRARVAAAAETRGLEGAIGGIDIGVSSIGLRDVDLHSTDGTSLRVRVGEVRLVAGLAGLATRGTSAVRRVRMRDVTIELDVDRALPDVLRRLRGTGTRSEARAASDRSVQVEGLEVIVRDPHGTLVQVRGGRAQLTSDVLRLAAGPVELAPEEPDGARAGQVAVRLRRREEGWKLELASAEGVALRYREREGDERNPLWSRVGADIDVLSPLIASEDDDEAEEGSAEPRDDGAEGEPGGALIGRIRAVLGPRLAPGALLQVGALSVRAGREDGARTVLRDLGAEVHAIANGRLELTGSGRPGRGGRLGWELTVDPDALRAEGRLEFQRLPFVLLVPLLPPLPFHRPEEARLSGALSIEGRGATRIHMTGDVSVDDLAFSSPRIAPHPVRGLAFGVAGDADWNPLTRTLDVHEATMTVGRASARLSGTLEWPADHYLVDLTATLPPTDCNTAVGAIPVDLLDEVAAFTFSGRIGGRIRARIDSRDLDATSLDVHVADGCLFETAPALADIRRFQAPFTHRVVEPDGTVFEMETGPGTSNWTPIRDMSPFFVRAVLGHEDGAFFQHHGFSVGSIRRALIRNLRAGRYAYGASTITMQLVKNVFLRREKTLARKAQEVLLTWWVEFVMSKEEILELYLNVIEYGPGVYGVRNAAEHYFGLTPDQLGPAESAYLATILPNPKAYHSQWEQGSVPERFQRRVDRFLQSLGSRHLYDEEAVAAGIAGMADLHFQHPGDPPREAEPPRGHAAPLPLGLSLDQQWDEAFPPDAVPADEESAGDSAP